MSEVIGFMSERDFDGSAVSEVEEESYIEMVARLFDC